jgi:hypothetical protein
MKGLCHSLRDLGQALEQDKTGTNLSIWRGIVDGLRKERLKARRRAGASF